MVAADYIIDQACKLPNLGDVQRFAAVMLDYIGSDHNNNDKNQTNNANQNQESRPDGKFKIAGDEGVYETNRSFEP